MKFLILQLFALQVLGATPPPFKFHIKKEPHNLDPVTKTSGTSKYIFSNLYRGLTQYTGQNRLFFAQAKKCRYQGHQQVTCHLRDDLKWSDGSPLKAEDFRTSFIRLLSSKSRSPALPLLLGITGATEYYQGKGSVDQVEIKALSPKKLRFRLKDPDREFLEKLSNVLLVPYKPLPKGQPKEKLVVNGPYKIKKWIPKKKIILEPNPYFQGGNPKRPPVEIIFSSEDSSALALYEKGHINFLWRLTTENIPAYRKRPDFFQVPVARFDYIGFNLRPGSPFADKKLRKAFAEGLKFDEYGKLMDVRGNPGCPGLDFKYVSQGIHCLKFNPKGPDISGVKGLEFLFSKLGGDDIRRQAQWLQAQWKQNVKAKVSLKSQEQKVMLSRLRNNPPPMFRKGIALKRPTCLAALETFLKDHPENFVGFNNPQYETLTRALSRQKLSRAEKASICGAAIDILFKKEFVGIPLGKIHFTMLARPEFKGWTVNTLNQLDLANLSYEGKSK